MDHLDPIAQSNQEDSLKRPDAEIRSLSFRDNPTFLASKTWRPLALRPPILITIVLSCWALIAVLQVFLLRSQRDNGVIFAPRINDLPLSQTFLFLYFPTVFAVVFSFFWTWIDLETKRMEPYYQLSKDNGALGKDSLLLAYPFDFLPLVPIKACKNRHWPVFWASFAVVLITWGVVPTQAGIFSTKTITRIIKPTFARSTGFVPAELQASTIPIAYTQSTYAIATLNETLTLYMGRNYTLAPFGPSSELEGQTYHSANWTAHTTMYSLDMYCEPAINDRTSTGTHLANSTNGCSFRLGLDGNLTIGVDKASSGEVLKNKEFTAMYTGYWNPNGFSDYSIDGVCPVSSNSTFYAAISRNKKKTSDPPQDVTAIYCHPMYYQQLVNATVDAITRKPLAVTPVGQKEPIPAQVFNSTWLETQMSSGSLGVEVRSDSFPINSSPRYLEYIAGTNLSLSTGSRGAGIVHPMVGLALAVSNRPLEEYLDWTILSKSYADAYRLMFARAMRDVLHPNVTSTMNITGQIETTTEALVLEPTFVYIVEGLLGLASLAALALLYLSFTRTRHLRSDPSTIAAIMSLIADNEPLLADFEDMDCCTVQGIKAIISNKRYKLIDDSSATGIIEISECLDANVEVKPTDQRREALSDIAKPVRPNEFSLHVAFPFVGLFIALAIVLAVIFAKARVQGLPLPSSNTIVQNILENYVPTALATLIEPMWILINRLLCMLQPLEQLQRCNAKAKESIDTDYSSLPPQLVIFKALRSKHFVLAAVCAMALLANLLAISFAGLFLQKTIDMRHKIDLQMPYRLKFVSIDGSIGPLGGRTFGSTEASGAYQGGSGDDQFIIGESNYTQGTPLPAWTDDKLFYLPFEGLVSGAGNTSYVEANTTAFGAELDCKELRLGDAFAAATYSDAEKVPEPAVFVSLNVSIPTLTGSARCTSPPRFQIGPGPIGAELNCVTGPSAVEIVMSLEPVGNATQAHRDACMSSVVLGWVRDAKGSCPIGKPIKFSQQNSVFVRCQPRWTTGTATIRVDSNGRLQQPATELVLDGQAARDVTNSNSSSLFSNDPVNLIGQSNKYIFKNDGGSWHNDSFAGDFINYFIRRGGDNTTMSLLDPATPVPTFEDITGQLNKAYSYLFAIWLGINKNQLLVSHEQNDRPTLEGWRVEPERRLFVSTPMFAIAESILAIYVVVAVIVYIRRPGQYLPRLPVSIAAVIALFAASAAVQDMRGTSNLDRKGRRRHLNALDARYGYGSYVGGGDGRVHIGIEKTPFVSFRSKATWFDKKVTSWRKGSTA